MIYNEKMGSIDIEKAIVYLVESITKYGHNPKPVILHCIRVANMLAFLGYDKDIIIGALLHDLYEDADISFEDIDMKFGSNIGDLVRYNSFDPKIEDKTQQYIEMFEKCRNGGKNCLIIKAADIYDNSFYYHLAKDEYSYNLLLSKMKYFIDIAYDIVGGEKIYNMLVEQYELLIKNNYLKIS